MTLLLWENKQKRMCNDKKLIFFVNFLYSVKKILKYIYPL